MCFCEISITFFLSKLIKVAPKAIGIVDHKSHSNSREPSVCKSSSRHNKLRILYLNKCQVCFCLCLSKTVFTGHLLLRVETTCFIRQPVVDSCRFDSIQK